MRLNSADLPVFGRPTMAISADIPRACGEARLAAKGKVVRRGVVRTTGRRSSKFKAQSSKETPSFRFQVQ
jgi:hypothetical protein